MAEWKTVRYDPNYPESLDPEIIPLCDALNAAGFVTTSSCSGHGGNMWAHVYFEHSTDARIESMARFVKARENVDYHPWFSMFQKEVLLDGYVWSIEVHLNEVYSDTPWQEALRKTGEACNRIAQAIEAWHKSDSGGSSI
jgi:tRNA(Phe) wybutosine-synthesizing methylase Tyw3